MLTFAQKPKSSHHKTDVKTAFPARGNFSQIHEVNSILRSKSTCEDQTAHRLIVENAGDTQGDSTANTAYLGTKVSRIQAYSSVPAGAQRNQTPKMSEEKKSPRGDFNFGKNQMSFPNSSSKSFSTITTGENDEGIFQTGVNDGSDASSSSFNTQDLGNGGTTPGPVTGPSHSCVPTVVSSSLPSGHIAATVSGGRFAAPFDMSADFDTPIPCNGICGEYRQFVSGYSQVNGTDIVHPLCGNNMSRTTEHEDCLTSGGTNYKYGYHSIPFTNSRFTNPDQATGWSYRGHDAPGFNLASFSSGTVLNWHLNFRGELVDACDNDNPIQPSATWTAGGTYTVP